MHSDKNIHGYQSKFLNLEVKDVDAQTRRVKVALSAFDNVDSDGDVIRKGSFSKSILERGPESNSNRKIAFLRHHDWEHQIGKFISLEETDYHLVGIGELGRSTKGNDALLDYQDGLIREHSIGFNYVEDKMSLQTDGTGKEYWNITEVKLWEGSAVTFGANSLTPTLDVSKGNQIELLDKINAKMDALTSALRNGKGTDERLYSIEMALQVIKSQYNSLLTDSAEAVKSTLKEQEPENVELNAEQIQKSFYLNLYQK